MYNVLIWILVSRNKRRVSSNFWGIDYTARTAHVCYNKHITWLLTRSGRREVFVIYNLLRDRSLLHANIDTNISRWQIRPRKICIGLLIISINILFRFWIDNQNCNELSMLAILGQLQNIWDSRQLSTGHVNKYTGSYKRRTFSTGYEEQVMLIMHRYMSERCPVAS